MSFFPIQYDEPLFRPPSEGQSLIIQVTLGCSFNKCAFCEMYTSKPFKTRSFEAISKDIEAFIPYSHSIRRVFLADGDALVLSTKRLLAIIDKLKATFPKLNRVSVYASASNLKNKTATELKELKDAGLNLVYVGLESGDDKVLENLKKGETFLSSIAGLENANKAELDCSVMIINGAGGKEFSNQHAINSAKLLNAIQPRYASTLVLTAYKGLDHLKQRVKWTFTPLKQLELFEEMQMFMENLNLNETIFRSDHVSNDIVLKGVLGRDKEIFLRKIHQAIQCNY